MGIIAGIVILLVLLSAVAQKPKTYTPITPEIYRTQIRQGHWEQRITGYKLRRNIIYDLIKEPSKYGYSSGYTDQEMYWMGFKEYTIEPQYGLVWVPE